MLLVKESKVLESRLSTGRASSMRLKGNMLIYRVSWRRRRLCGKVSLNSLRNKKNKPRETKKKASSNSKLPSINFKRLMPIANPKMSKITVWSCNNWSKSSRKKEMINKSNTINKTINNPKWSKDSKKRTKQWMKDWNWVKITVSQALQPWRENSREPMRKTTNSRKKTKRWKTSETEKLMSFEEPLTEKRKCFDKRTQNCNKRARTQKENKLNWFWSMRLTGPSGNKRRVDSWHPKKISCKNWNLFRGNKKIKWRKLRDWRSKIRETIGEQPKDRLEELPLITLLLPELEQVFWADLTLVEVVLGLAEQQEDSQQVKAESIWAHLDQVLEDLTKAQINSNPLLDLNSDLV